MAVHADTTGKFRQNPADLMSVAGLALPSWRRIWITIVVAAAVILPFMVEDFTVFQFTLVAIYAVAILGLNLLTGFNGQFSLGHSAFFAVGAYTTAILMDQWGMAYYWTLFPAAGTTGVMVSRCRSVWSVLTSSCTSILKRASFSSARSSEIVAALGGAAPLEKSTT